MSHSMAFHLGLHCLTKYMFRGFQYTKGYLLLPELFLPSCHTLTLCKLGKIFMILLSADFFKINIFIQKILSEVSSECQTVRIQNKPGILMSLIWVQTVCKGYQQMVCLFVCFEVLHPSQQLWSCRDCQFT